MNFQKRESAQNDSGLNLKLYFHLHKVSVSPKWKTWKEKDF
jgi:hypothetical protein